MVRINLLPPEIIEKRKYERYYPYVFITAGVIIAVAAFAFFALQLIAGQRAQVLQLTQEDTARLSQQAEAIAVFERKEQELIARKQSADQALAGRIDMGKVAEDISLVLPDEVWLVNISCSEETGLSLEGLSPRPYGTASKEGYKSVAATLVRLSSLRDLSDVWLSEAKVVKFTSFQPVLSSQGASATVLSFTSTGDIVRPNAVAASSPTVPSPAQ